jgi:hypothetical protein
MSNNSGRAIFPLTSGARKNSLVWISGSQRITSIFHFLIFKPMYEDYSKREEFILHIGMYEYDSNRGIYLLHL